MTETTILDESAVSEIEAQLADCTTVMFPITANRLRTVIATVKHLRAELNTTKGHWVDTSEDLASSLLKREELQSQLEQLRAERDRLLRGDFTDEELQGFCHNLSEQDQDAFFEGCTKYQERLFGTSAIAQLKENQ